MLKVDLDFVIKDPLGEVYVEYKQELNEDSKVIILVKKTYKAYEVLALELGNRKINSKGLIAQGAIADFVGYNRYLEIREEEKKEMNDFLESSDSKWPPFIRARIIKAIQDAKEETKIDKKSKE